VHDRRGEKTDSHHRYKRPEETVEGGENLQRIGGVALGIEGARAAQQHAALKKGIHPVEFANQHVAGHSHAQRKKIPSSGPAEIVEKPGQ